MIDHTGNELFMQEALMGRMSAFDSAAGYQGKNSY